MFQVTLVESRFVILHVLLETSMDRAIMICRYGIRTRSCLFALKIAMASVEQRIGF